MYYLLYYIQGANCLRGRIFKYTPPLGSVLLQYLQYMQICFSLKIMPKFSRFDSVKCHLQNHGTDIDKVA